MKHIYQSLLIGFMFFALTFVATAKTKVACIGNSITANTALAEADRYPAILQRLLGMQDYEVRNYGVSGRTLLKHGDFPYWNESKYREALSWNPDIVIIKLGTNDTKSQNWRYKDEFVADYLALIKSFATLGSKPKIYVCYPIAAFENTMNIKGEIVINEIIPKIDEIATQAQVSIIDLHTPFINGKSMLYDGVHPGVKGTTVMANVIGQSICPECNIPNLGDDFFLNIASFDYTDKYVNIASSSLSEIDLTKLIDNDALTTFSLPFKSDTWFSVELDQAFKLTGYSVSSGKNEVENNPKAWILQGSNNGTSWVDIDGRTKNTFLPLETKVFEVPYTSTDQLGAYKHIRLLVTENNGGADLSLGELQLFGYPIEFENTLTNNGGKITGEYAGYTGEGVENLIDKLIGKKYCVVDRKKAWVQYDSPVATAIEKYTLTSCYNLFERNLKSWQLLGWEEGAGWIVLDEQTNQDFMVKFNTVEYPVKATGKYSKFRLNITEINGGSTFQFAEFQLFEKKESSIETSGFTDHNVFTRDGNIYIQAENESLEYKVITISGKHIAQGSVATADEIIERPQAGVYLVWIKNSRRNSVTKIVL